MQHVDISKVSAVSQQLHLVAEFQLKECAGIIIWIAASNRVAHIMCMLVSISGSPLEPPGTHSVLACRNSTEACRFVHD